MTREFSLVLVGSGILTAGYFLYPEEDVEAKQKEQVEQQLAGNQPNNQQHAHRIYRPGFIWIHTGAWSSGGGYRSRSAAMGGNVSRGGFGGMGRGSVGG
jgi:hypothetical protein